MQQVAVLAAGLAAVDVPKSEYMPSAAYRKLSEAFACVQRWPAPTDRVVDLGACPGGWRTRRWRPRYTHGSCTCA